MQAPRTVHPLRVCSIVLPLLSGPLLFAFVGCGDDDAEASPDAGPETVEQSAQSTEDDCSRDRDCDDKDFCNGEERCQLSEAVDGGSDSRGTCVPGTPPCASLWACDADTRTCDCDRDRDGKKDWTCGGADPDADGDGSPACELDGGDPVKDGCDCDDHDATRSGKLKEKCEPEGDGHDEDCNPETYGGRDSDKDGEEDARCFNIAEDGTRHGGTDCRDNDREVSKKHPEICDDKDNDCDELVDEGEPSDGVPYSQQHEYYRDADTDGVPANDSSLQCDVAHPYTIPLTHPLLSGDWDPVWDCNEDVWMDAADGMLVLPSQISPLADEVCDGLDNDCDGKVDADDDDMINRPDFTDTVVECIDGSYQIVKCPEGRLWCDTSTAQVGCETISTELESCGDCETDCRFACDEREARNVREVRTEACEEVASVTVGYEFACAVTDRGRVSCWGRGFEGRLGDGRGASSAVPTGVIGLTDVAAASAGGSHACAIVGEEADVYCWGNDAEGQLGSDDAFGASAVPARASSGALAYFIQSSWLTGVSQLDAGPMHSCAALANGNAACWGLADNGRLGSPYPAMGPSLATPVFRGTPEDPVIVDDATQVAVGYAHSCLRTRQGTVECWGGNGVGQLAVDPQSEGTRVFAGPVHGLPDVVDAIAAGGDHTCALAAGRVYCWGGNGEQQLGHAASPNDFAPAEVIGLPNARAITAGIASTCAITDEDDVYCWGRPITGTGSGPQEPTRMPVTGTQQFAVAVGACSLDGTPQLRCWGPNEHGQVGIGRFDVAGQPVREPSDVSPWR